MRIQKTISWALAGLIFLFGASGIGQNQALAAEEVNAKLDNATCLTCHDQSKGELKSPSGQSVHGVDKAKYGKSVHSTLQCVSCHTEITDAVATHKLGSAVKPDCVTCHTGLWDAAKKANQTKEKSRLGVVVQNIEAYKESYHSRPNKDDKTHVNATCDDCHNTHTFSVPRQGTPERGEWHLTIPNVCGSKCHADELEEYSSSIHGKKVLEEHNQKAAVCTDCHTSHGIANTSKEGFKTTIADNCGNCHVENLKSYRATYHGQVNKLGFGYTAKCFDCHGSHSIVDPKDPSSPVNPKNRLKTCQKCHKEATKGFVTFTPHANGNNFERYPQVWIVSKFMFLLLVGVFAFFWLHSLLWWYREAQVKKAEKAEKNAHSGKGTK